MTRTSKETFLTGAALSLLLLLSGLPLAAQDETEATAEEEAQEVTEGILDVIVVTAQKREEDVQEVPISVSTLDAEQVELLSSGGADVRFLSGRVPSLTIESSFGRAFPRFYIRGLGNTDFDLNASQPVSLVYDEVVLENPVVKGMPVWDLERTEVLRGPQGTLFGRNTPAGIVKFDSKKPTDDFDAFVKLSYGTYGATDVKAAVGGPIGDTVSYRISGLYQAQSDWVDNTYTGKKDDLGGYDTTAYRLQLLWEPTESFKALFNVHGWSLDGTARLFRANIIKPGTHDLVNGFQRDKVAYDGLNDQSIDAYGGVIKLDWDLGFATLTSVTGYETLDMFSRGDIDGGYGAVYAPPSGPGFIPFSAESADGIPNIDQTTQELRLTSNSEGPFKWLTGFFYWDESLRVESFSYDSLSPGNPQNGFAYQEQDATAWALFASVDYAFTDRFSMKAGIRYSDEEKDFTADRPQPVFQPPLSQPLKRSVSDSFTSWDLSGTFKLNPNVNLFGRVATSFRAPSIQGRIMFAPDFEDGQNPDTNGLTVAKTEDILSVEMGVKSELANRRVRLNITPYWYEVNDLQLTVVGGQYNIAQLKNPDSVEGYGFEAELVLAPIPEWLITLGLSNNHTEIQDKYITAGLCGSGCTILDPIAPNGEAYLDGNPLPHSPEWIFNGIIDYRSTVGPGLLIGSLDWAYYDEKNFFVYESQEYQDDSFEVGLRLGYTFADAKYEAALYGRNIFDDESLRGGIDFNNLTGFTNDPPMWGLEFIARF